MPCEKEIIEEEESNFQLGRKLATACLSLCCVFVPLRGRRQWDRTGRGVQERHSAQHKEAGVWVCGSELGVYRLSISTLTRPHKYHWERFVIKLSPQICGCLLHARLDKS